MIYPEGETLHKMSVSRYTEIRLVTAEIIAQIDAEISRLQQARALLTTGTFEVVAKAKRGRPKGSTNKPAAGTSGAKSTKRKLTPEGRKAIADAMKRRWAERKKQKVS